jgi:hypothetical protein
VKALSVRQPWVWAILEAGKDVENRDWKSAWAPAGRLFLHAAGTFDRAEFDADAAKIEAICGQRPPPFSKLKKGGLVATFRVARAVRHDRPTSPWATPGLVHLHLVDVRPVPFVPMKGQLGFFEVPASLEEQAVAPRPQQASLFGKEDLDG